MISDNDEDRQEWFQQIRILIVGLVAISWICARVALASDLPNWTQEDHRTQGGGWIWFPGKYLALTEIGADVMAKGMAVAYLMEECQLPHKEIRFNERHVEEVDGKYRVYVRAAIKDSQCREGKYGSAELREKVVNRSLLTLYRQYKLKVTELQIADKVCAIDPLYCLGQARQEAHMENWYRAYIYAERSCRAGLEGGCKSAKSVAKFLIRNDQ